MSDQKPVDGKAKARASGALFSLRTSVTFRIDKLHYLLKATILCKYSNVRQQFMQLFMSFQFCDTTLFCKALGLE